MCPQQGGVLHLDGIQYPFGAIEINSYLKDWGAIRSVAFSPSHLFFYEMNEIEKRIWFATDQPLAAMERQAGMGPCITLMSGGRPFVSWGIILLTKTSAEMWLAADEELLRDNSRPFLRIARRTLDEIGPAMGLLRVQFTIAKGYHDGIRFAEWLKFETEGTLRRFAPDGSDCLIMSRIY